MATSCDLRFPMHSGPFACDSDPEFLVLVARVWCALLLLGGISAGRLEIWTISNRIPLSATPLDSNNVGT